jgi:hypothetical protein
VHVRLKASVYLAPFAGGDENMLVDREPAFLASLNIPNLAAHYPGSNSVEKIQNRPLDQEPYWHIERARIGNTREVSVELVMNGKPVAQKNLLADGAVREIAFEVPAERSSWLACASWAPRTPTPFSCLWMEDPFAPRARARSGASPALTSAGRRRLPRSSKLNFPMRKLPMITPARFIQS